MTKGRPKSAQVAKRRAIIAELHSLDIPGGVARQLLGMSISPWQGDIRATGLKFRSGTNEREVARNASKGRAKKMCALYQSGMTLEAIGQRHGLTRERVRQLMTKHLGITQKDGGQRVKAVANQQRSAAVKDARYLQKYGCTFAQYVEVRQIGRDMIAAGRTIYETPLRAFVQQKNNAKPRGITWEMSFWQWWTVWQQSGKWSERGRAKDAYVMSRFGDEGAYAVGNVVICTLAQNSSAQPNNPYRADHPDHAQLTYERLKRSIVQRVSGEGLHTKNTDLPRGVTRTSRSPRYQAQATIGGKPSYLGSFDTPEAAHAAYVSAVTADVNTAHKFSEA